MIFTCTLCSQRNYDKTLSRAETQRYNVTGSGAHGGFPGVGTPEEGGGLGLLLPPQEGRGLGVVPTTALIEGLILCSRLEGGK